MAKLRYIKHYNGIQPGTVVNEHREDAVARLTKKETIIDEKGNRKETVPYAEIVGANVPTTGELERAASKKDKARETVTA